MLRALVNRQFPGLMEFLPCSPELTPSECFLWKCADEQGTCHKSHVTGIQCIFQAAKTISIKRCVTDCTSSLVTSDKTFECVQ